MYTDIMIDIETTSTKYNACVLTIGAVAFNLFNPNIPRVSFECLINKDDSDLLGFHTCENTLAWWDKQPAKSRKRAFDDGPRMSVKESVESLSTFCNKYPVVRYWAQGINFDYVILESLYEKVNVSVPWKFYKLRDSRTIQHMFSNIKIEMSNDHDAVSDCHNQIDMLINVYKRLKLIKNDILI